MQRREDKSGKWAIALIVLLVAVQQTVTPGSAGLFAATLGNMLHVPLFAIITLLLLELMPRAGNLKLLMVAMTIAVATEAAQLLNSRDASLADIANNFIGIAAVLGGRAITANPLRGGCAARRWVPAWMIWSGVFVLIGLVTLTPPALVLLAYDQRDRAFPVLWDPDARFSNVLLGGNSSLRLVQADHALHALGREQALEIAWQDEPYPRMDLREVVRDWSDFDVVVIEVNVPDGKPMPLTLALGYRDHQVAPPVATRTLTPGIQTLRFRLPGAYDQRHWQAPLERLVLRTRHTSAGRTLLVGRINLEVDPAPVPAAG